MSASAKRGSEMIKQILAFARGVGGEPAVLDLNPLLTEMEKLARETFPRAIRIQTRADPQLYPVMGNATQLHQVLLNLCINARDAMPHGGSLRVEAQNITLENKATRLHPEPVSGPHVLLTVTDTGQGISPELLDRIFEPFFTTKAPGKGTGLGLSTVLGIVKSHGGFLDFTSTPGQGTTFQVYLPAHFPEEHR
jgi:signal transduction histidine kinase